MTKRRIDTHEACLIDFSTSLKKEIKFWLNDLDARERMANVPAPRAESAMARVIFQAAISTLIKSANDHDIPLADLGLVDYGVMSANDR
ncbi:MAG: hypothetical protein WBD34_10230 [Burkholderiaceae bacterium]